jgi:DNA processing protein
VVEGSGVSERSERWPAELPDAAYAATLASLSWLGPSRLRRLLARWPAPEAWAAVRAGAANSVWGAGEPPTRVVKLAPLITAAAAKAEPARVWAQCRRAEVGVHFEGAADYPAIFLADPDPPPVLFSRGDLGVLDGRRVTIVGTRNATATGREVAAELGGGLAAAGVRVVSGLARGIDGWAHRGALAVEGGAPPVGVVASGLDVVYPPEHRQLWLEVGERGLLLSEVPPGTPPFARRFPLRNRILAALGELVVVVESRARGGSLHTVDEAIVRGVPVLAVPGSPRSPASDGANQLLMDGAQPVVSSRDVLIALGFTGPKPTPAAHVARCTVPAADRWAFDLLGAEPRDLDALVLLSGRDVVEVAAALGRLELDGWVDRRGGWFARAGGGRRPAAPPVSGSADPPAATPPSAGRRE